MGTSFIDSHIKDVSFLECQVEYANFYGSKIENFKVCESDFRWTTFSEVLFKNVFLDKVHFEEAEFFHTSLRQIDFSTCFIEGTLFDYTSVQGMIIDMFQSPTIVRLLGVKIKDDLS